MELLLSADRQEGNFFLNTDTESGVKVAEESVAWKYYGYASVINRINLRA